MQDVRERVSVLEVQVDHMEKTLQTLSESHNEHRDITLQIKERLDKQNGLIPHMAESVREIADAQKEMMQQFHVGNINDAKTNVKVKILWSSLLAISATILGYVLKGFLG